MTPHPREIEDALSRAGRLQGAGRLGEAEALLRRLAAEAPGDAEAYWRLGLVHQSAGRLAEAAASLERAVALAPQRADLHNDLGGILLARGEPAAAATAFERALALAPELVEAHYNLGRAHQARGEPRAALAAFDAALERCPDHAQALNNKGTVLRELGRLEEALDSFNRALAAAPGLAEAHHNRGNLLKDRDRLEEAIHAFRRATELAPGHGDAAAQLVHQLQHACDWRRLPACEDALDRLTDQALARGERPGETPFLALTRKDDPERQLAIAAAWSAELARRAVEQGGPLAPRPARPAGRRLTIGYLSGDVRDHRVTRSMLGILARHDRSRFKVVAYAYGPDDSSGLRDRVRARVDGFTVVEGMSLRAAATCIRADGVDILVDLTGQTRDSRSTICAFRPAPVQTSFLGFPGPSGAGWMDWLIADPVVAPSLPAGAEAQAHLPGCFLVDAPEPEEPAAPLDRRLLGLPEQGVVFASFNAPFKITREVFASWMRILARVPGSVLWLVRANDLALGHLRREARRHGIEEGRLVFAERVPYAQNLARLALADIGLDTHPYNGGVTTSNALFAGVPVVARNGRAYVARMGASLLTAAGCGELVMADEEAYVDLAVALAGDPARRLELRSRLQAARAGAPLFDPEGAARGLEGLYLRMWAERVAGRAPTLLPATP